MAANTIAPVQLIGLPTVDLYTQYSRVQLSFLNGISRWSDYREQITN